MSLTLVLEHQPVPQAETRRTLEAGELTIGRDAACDWQIDDPEKYVSRRHCTVLVEDGRATVTDTSSGGLYIDGADQPLGAGNSTALEHGMRLRLGDYVLRVEMAAADRPAAPARDPGPFDFDFGEAPPYEPPPERPADLPPRFRGAMSTGAFADEEPEKKRGDFRFDDPFSLESDSARSRPAPPEPPAAPGGYFDTPSGFDAPRERAPREERDRPAQRPVTQPPTPDPGAGRFPMPEPPRPAPPEPPRAPTPEPAPAPTPTADDNALREAFFRGLGMTPPRTDDPVAEMEALGHRFRALTEGLMQLLRARSQEKQNVRVAQTVIGSADVNPLKFLPTPGEGVESLVQDRGPGYLDPDAAIAAAYRDLADHQMRTWVAVQSALRRMIDRFDPEAIEKELEDMGLLEALLAGGRSAKLWQLYEDRYAEIAKSAEDRFLGEVGADFRNAYEQGRGR